MAAAHQYDCPESCQQQQQIKLLLLALSLLQVIIGQQGDRDGSETDQCHEEQCVLIDQDKGRYLYRHNPGGPEDRCQADQQADYTQRTDPFEVAPEGYRQQDDGDDRSKTNQWKQGNQFSVTHSRLPNHAGLPWGV